MTVKLLKESVNSEYLFLQKFGVLQMVLVISKIQVLITKSLVWFDILPCNPPLTPQVYSNMIHNALMLPEMILLGILARNLYKREVPTIQVASSKRESIISTVFGDALGKINHNDSPQGSDNLGYS